MPRTGTSLTRVAAQPVDADVHRADEPRPVLVVGEPTRDARVAGDEQHDREHDERDAARPASAIHAWSASSSDGRIAKPDEHQHRQRDEAGEPFEHDGAERDRPTTRSCSTRGDAHDVAADRRRQHVADEHAGEVVVRERAERDAAVEQAAARAASATPTARRRGTSSARPRRGGRSVSAWCCSGMMSSRLGTLPCQHREERARLTRMPQRELPSRSGAARDRRDPPSSPTILGGASGPVSRDHGADAHHDGRRCRARSRGGRRRVRACCSCTGSAARRKTSPTTSPSLARDHTVVVFDHRGHGASDKPADRGAYSLERLATDTLAVADAAGFDSLPAARPFDGRHGRAQGRARARPNASTRSIMMDTSAGPIPAFDPS